MEILKLSTDWARAEVFSAKIVWLFSVMTLLVAFGFWYWGKSAMSKAFVWPMVVTGVFLTIVGAGLFFANKPRILQFQQVYVENPKSFVQQEVQRTGKSQKDLGLVFKVLPILLIVAGLLILFLPAPVWRAIGITLALLVAFLMVVDSNTNARNSLYHEQLKNFRNDYGRK